MLPSCCAPTLLREQRFLSMHSLLCTFMSIAEAKADIDSIAQCWQQHRQRSCKVVQATCAHASLCLGPDTS